MRRVLAYLASVILVAPGIIVVVARASSITGDDASLRDRAQVAGALIVLLLVVPPALLGLLYGLNPSRQGSWWLLPVTFVALAIGALVRDPVAIVGVRDPAYSSLFAGSWSLASTTFYLVFGALLWVARPRREPRSTSRLAG